MIPLLHDVRELMQKFKPAESSRIAYLPIIMERLCFEYATRFCCLAADYKQPLTKQCRAIRDNISAFEAKNRKLMHPSTIAKLDKITDSFFRDTGYDTQRLYWAVNFQLKKKYTCLSDVHYLLLTEAICAIVISNYVARFKRAADAEMSRRLGIPDLNTIDTEFTNVMSVLFKYCGDYNLRNNQMVSTGLQIIARWANALKFPDMDE